MEQDIRWRQRFSNYCKALSQLEKFILKIDLNELKTKYLYMHLSLHMNWHKRYERLSRISGQHKYYGFEGCYKRSFSKIAHYRW